MIFSGVAADPILSRSKQDEVYSCTKMGTTSEQKNYYCYRFDERGN
jgi:hypothetical protein